MKLIIFYNFEKLTNNKNLMTGPKFVNLVEQTKSQFHVKHKCVIVIPTGVSKIFANPADILFLQGDNIIPASTLMTKPMFYPARL
jgi:hypothetical protein